MTRTLPYDNARCEPECSGSQCQACLRWACLRWACLPGQTWGERTPQASVEAPGAPGCRYEPQRETDEVPTLPQGR